MLVSSVILMYWNNLVDFLVCCFSSEFSGLMKLYVSKILRNVLISVDVISLFSFVGGRLIELMVCIMFIMVVMMLKVGIVLFILVMMWVGCLVLWWWVLIF